MEVHARTRIVGNGFGHETGSDAVAASLGADDTLEADQVIGGLQHIFAIVQRQLILARRIFGYQRFSRKPSSLAAAYISAKSGSMPSRWSTE